jgi:hypothetical protein
LRSQRFALHSILEEAAVLDQFHIDPARRMLTLRENTLFFAKQTLSLKVETVFDGKAHHIYA